MDLLAGAEWRCLATEPDRYRSPAELPAVGRPDADWLPATVPGTAAGAQRLAGRSLDGFTPDEHDWWWRTTVPGDAPAGAEVHLRSEGLATIAEVWLAGRQVLSSNSMWARHDLVVPATSAGDELAVRFAALAPVLARRHPRPRWKAAGIQPQSLRWWRTSLLGRMGGISPVPSVAGPWRPLTLTCVGDIASVTWSATLDGDDGVVDVELHLADHASGAPVEVEIAGRVVAAVDMDDVRRRATVRVPSAERWWPHTHGEPTRYPIVARVAGAELALGQAGFRTVHADRSNDGFTVVVNDVDIFCRGAGWVPCDPVGMDAPATEVRATLAALRDAGMNMVRVSGGMVYEDETFFDICDELGLMVWQDLMNVRMDPPDDVDWLRGLDEEIRSQAGGWQRHPSIAVVCGGTEVHQQAAMLGLDSDRRNVPVLEQHVAATVGAALPGVPYVPSSPYSASGMPLRPGFGVSHYFGVGAYRRPLGDARTSGVRFASECLAFSLPPDAPGLRAMFGTNDPEPDLWRRGTPKDEGAGWDFGDVSEHYARLLSPPDCDETRDRLSHATGTVIAATLAEWRRPASPCRGALLIAARDVVPGPGWGLLDASGHPKSAWWMLRRILQPVSLLLADEGLGGLVAWIVNDTAEELACTVRVETLDGDRIVESGQAPVVVPARDGVCLDAEVVLGGFRDLTAAYRFGAPSVDAVLVTCTRNDRVVGRAMHFVRAAAPAADVDLQARAAPLPGGRWRLDVTSRVSARGVVVDVAGFELSDNWFDLPAGVGHSVLMHPTGEIRQPRGTVRLAAGGAPVELEVTER